MRTIVILRLSDLIKGYFYGIWLRVVGFRKHHKPLRSTEMVTYIEFQNPHVLIMGTVYSEIGLGVYQGDAVIIREGLCSSEYLRRWVIYKLEDHHLKGHEVEEFLKTACRLAQTILHHKHSESCLKDWQRSDEPAAKSAHRESRYGQPELSSPVVCDDIEISPIEDVVYQIIQKCPRIKYYLNSKSMSTTCKQNLYT